MSRRKSPPIPAPGAEQALDFMYQVQVLNVADFDNEWKGWRMRASTLISPQGDRVTARRLAGLLFLEKLRAKPKSKTPAPVVALPVAQQIAQELPAAATLHQMGKRSRVA